MQPDLAAWLMEQTRRPENINPCVRKFGRGPDGVKCKACRLLYRKRYSKTYIKCSLRLDTNGPGTDHRANWPACARFEPLSQ